MILEERANAVQVITLNRPDKRNALHPEMISALRKTLELTEQDSTLKVVILTGAGSSFSAGLDLKHMGSLDGEGRADYLGDAFALFRKVYELRQPVIAAVNGPAMAGGFDLAAFCDLRLCSTAAQFAQTEILLGLTQIMYPIYKAIGLSRAKELALTGKAISAEDAYRIGLVSDTCSPSELMQRARKLAEELATRPPAALFETKRLSRELIGMDFDSGIAHMLDAISARARSDEHRSALEDYLTALRQRRQPGRG